jgi:hypothetical protein
MKGHPATAAAAAVSGEVTVTSASAVPGDVPLVLPDSLLPDIHSEASATRFPWTLAITGLTAAIAGLGGLWWWRRDQSAA